MKQLLLVLLLWCRLFVTCSSEKVEAAAVTTLFVGDSDIEGWSTDSVFSNSANVGVGGWTCGNVLKKFDKFLNDYPSAETIVLVCGENDMWYQSVGKTFGNFVNILTAATDNGIKQVIYVGTKPEPGTKKLHKKYRQYDTKIREKATELALGTNSQLPPLVMIDVYPIFDEIEQEDPGALYKKDDLHLNDYGYTFWTKWTQTALDDNEGMCVVWKDNVCDIINGTPFPTSTPAPTTFTTLPKVILANPSLNTCPSGYQKIQSVQGCRAALPLIDSFMNDDFEGVEDSRNWPAKCYYCNNVNGCSNGVWFNTHASGKAKTGAKPICALPDWEVCGDDSDWTSKKNSDHNCDWVAKKARKRCITKGTDNRRALAACTYTCRGSYGSNCGSNCKTDDTTWKTTRGKNCNWVKNKPNKRCRKKGKDGRRALTACEISCIWHGSTCTL